MNKLAYFFLLLMLVSASCNQDSGSEKNSADSAKDKVQQGQKADLTQREMIIAELKQMELAFRDKDVNRIEKYFNFPLADTTLSLYEINEDFDLARKANGGKISRDLFIKNFNDIYDYFQLGDFSDLFKAIDLAELKSKQELTSEKHMKDEACYSFYGISIEGDTVELRYGTNSDDKYREAHPEQEEACGEAAFTWIFKLEGNKLRFVREMTAG
jgi:hypothetical protein